MNVNTAGPDTAAMRATVPPAARIDAVIIIFGAAVRPDGTPSPTLRHRVEAAARFGSRFAYPLFIPTGGKGRHGAAEAVVMANLLNRVGFPDTAIVTEATGTDTLSSVRAVRRLVVTIRPAGGIYVATSSYHLPRCLLLLRLAGVRARASQPPPVPASTSQWLRWYWRLRETPALPYDALLMMFLRATGRI
jgi:uncharacterized SAM-binding protein YcdF (DUF218 family)